MRKKSLCWVWVGVLAVCGVGASEPAPWKLALAGMAWPSGVRDLNPTNLAPLVLEAFGSNAVVKAVVFLPGATDELYHFRRARVEVALPRPTFLDVVEALTNQTFIRATFRAPFLLLHAKEDPTEPLIEVTHEAMAGRLRQKRFLGHLVSNDRDWDFVQPLLERRLNVFVRPPGGTQASWHFYRHSLAAWDLTGWEALEAVSLAGMTAVRVERRALVFKGDTRPRFWGIW